MIVIGLTGGIGMGKSNAASVLRRAGLPVFDADAVVHALQGRGGRAVLSDPAALRRLEAIVHPLVRQEERRFLERSRREGRRAVVLDIPLLFESGGASRADQIVVVSAPRDVQRHRVRSRRKMTPAQVEAVIARQMPDAEKRRRADAVVRTGLSRHYTQLELRRFLQRVLG